MDLTRLPRVTKKDQESLEKYERARVKLNSRDSKKRKQPCRSMKPK